MSKTPSKRLEANVMDLPPYSPDLNPIELAFSETENAPAKIRRTNRRESLWNQIGQIVDQFSPQECRNYFKHCGYTAH
ncbi:MAG: hypothetical protein R3B91_20605 [Planctomycetaceae bacterium]